MSDHPNSSGPAGGRRAAPLDGWGSRLGVVLAVAGSAVGLGNFLRFPGQAAQNGGGAFLIPYFISLLVLGIPLCWAEWTMGRYGGSRGFNSAPGIFGVVWRRPVAKYLAMPALLIPLVIYMYYVVIEAWCLGYALSYLTGDLMLGNDAEAYGAFFADFVGVQEDGALVGSQKSSLLLLVGLTFALNFVLIYRGVAKGIESFCKIAIPAMVICALVVLARVLTLPSHESGRTVLDGLSFMWEPDFDALRNPQTWLAASSQIFFSLSVGFGVIINYSSYLKRGDDVVLSGLTATSMNEFFEVCLGGLITLPAAFLFLGAAVGDQGTFGLGFNALPNVFAEMPAGRMFGFLWFFMLFLAAITSSLSMLQPVIAFFEEGFGLPRPASASLLGLVSALGSGFVLYFSKDLVALDMFDFWVGTVLIFVLAMIQALLYGWALGIERGAEIAHEGAQMRIPHIVQLTLKYIAPVYLGVVFLMFCWQNVLSNDERLGVVAGADALLKSGATAEAVDAAVAEALPDAGFSIPADAEFAEKAPGKRWEIRAPAAEGGAEGALLAMFRLEDRGATLYRRQAGYLERIGQSRVAGLSVLFIGTVGAFLLVMIHIAAMRWDAVGRLDGLRREPAA